ncbi:MAG: hypothetical protein LBG94_05675 [Treponema sp.]|nr:hypothetical protein [Treponema sp.]
MKRLVLLLLVLGIAASLFAQVLPQHQFASGNWGLSSNRLYQNDANARLAKVNMQIPQSGTMMYPFNVRYEGGFEDGHGGFGIHIFMDTAFNGASWGAGNSYLLWLNYDEHPIANSGIPYGLSAQVYKSVNNSTMNMVGNFPLNEYTPYLLASGILSQPIPVNIMVNGNTGEVRVYDPTDSTGKFYFYFNLDQRDLPLRGNWIALRTNGLKASFGQ